MAYTIKVLSNKDFDALPYKGIRESYGIADRKKGTAYVRDMGNVVTQAAIQHEADELVNKFSNDEDEDGMRHGWFNDLFGFSSQPFVPALAGIAGGLLGGPIGGALGSTGFGAGAGAALGNVIGQGTTQGWGQVSPLEAGLYGVGGYMGGNSQGYQAGYQNAVNRGSGYLGQVGAGAHGMLFGTPEIPAGTRYPGSTTPVGYDGGYTIPGVGNVPAGSGAAGYMSGLNVGSQLPVDATRGLLGSGGQFNLFGGGGGTGATATGNAGTQSLSDQWSVGQTVPGGGPNSTAQFSAPATTPPPTTQGTDRGTVGNFFGGLGDKLGGLGQYLPSAALMLGAQGIKQPEDDRPSAEEQYRQNRDIGNELFGPVTPQGQAAADKILQYTQDPTSIATPAVDQLKQSIMSNIDVQRQQAIAEVDGFYAKQGTYGGSDHARQVDDVRQRFEQQALQQTQQLDVDVFNEQLRQHSQAITQAYNLEQSMVNNLIGLTNMDIQEASERYGVKVQTVADFRKALQNLAGKAWPTGDNQQSININLKQ